jgi:O-antigen biosynthesis protein WbqP
MRIDTPKDTPTHLLENPDQWITKVGKFLRRTSLDELPQIINIFKGEMSIIGPRPALWNQYDLIEERDKYGANDIPVGLTGWAQINGRDELDIDVKARLDGEYVKKRSLWFDLICFIGTFITVLKSKGVIEGGTGVIAKMTKDKSKGVTRTENTEKESVNQ